MEKTMQKNFWRVHGTKEGKSIPTFLLDGDQLGIVNESNALKYAYDIVGEDSNLWAIKINLDTINPNVLMIVHKETQKVVSVVEQPATVNNEKIIKHWVAWQGLSESTETQFCGNGCAILKWNEIEEVFDPIERMKYKLLTG
jgi:hypothetical protein